MRIGMLTREYPPEVYGGGGVHVEFLVRELRKLGVDLQIADAASSADLLHSHTWYANLAGVLGSMLSGVPHVLTAHSLEPQRPWKAEQLGGGYRISSWAERQAYETAAAVIAVSYGMRADVLDAYPFVDPARVHV